MNADQLIELVSHPTDWPTPWRKAFVIGLPITLPVWLALMVALVVLLTAAALVIYPWVILEGLWKGEERW